VFYAHTHPAAAAAIQNAAAAVAIQVKGGIVIATEKRVASKLLAPPKSSEKIYTIDDHVIDSTETGLEATVRASALPHYRPAGVLCSRGSDVRCERAHRPGAHRLPSVTSTRTGAAARRGLVQLVANTKHSYTQYGGLRPFSITFLLGGWDAHLGFQLYQSDPAGNYGAWKATAIGANSTSAQSGLKAEYSEDLSLADATK